MHMDYLNKLRNHGDCQVLNIKRYRELYLSRIQKRIFGRRATVFLL